MYRTDGEERVADVDEQENEETSKVDRLKGRIKDLVGGGSDEEEAQSADGSDEAASGDSGSSGDTEGSADEGAGEEDSDDDAPGPEDVSLDTYAEDEGTAQAQIQKMEEEGPPENLGDWPTGKAMYLSFGGAEGEQGYEEGPARQMGPSSLRHYQDGSVEVRGEMADNPEQYKADQSVTEEAEQLGMDKGAKGSGGDDDSGSEDSEATEGAEGSEGSDHGVAGSAGSADGSEGSAGEAEAQSESPEQS